MSIWNWLVILVSVASIVLMSRWTDNQKAQSAAIFRECEKQFERAGCAYDAEYSRRYAARLESGHWTSEKKIIRQMTQEGWKR